MCAIVAGILLTSMAGSWAYNALDRDPDLDDYTDEDDDGDDDDDAAVGLRHVQADPSIHSLDEKLLDEYNAPNVKTYEDA